MTITTRALPLRSWRRLLRPRQWAKNALVFAAPLGAGVIFHPEALAGALSAFAVFSLAASSMYLVNDVLDADRDRTHPSKRNRPIASGEVSPGSALRAAIVLAVTACGAALIIDPGLLLVITIYLALTLAYSFRLKHVAVVDMVIVASGFVLRGVAGGVATGVPVSSWFLIVVSFGALFVSAGKRYAELFNGSGAEHRPSLDGYSPEYLRHVLTLSAGLVSIAYALWAFEVPRDGAAGILMEFSIVPLVTALLRYSHLVMQGQGGEPEEIFLRDRELLALGALWLGLFASGVSVG